MRFLCFGSEKGPLLHANDDDDEVFGEGSPIEDFIGQMGKEVQRNAFDIGSALLYLANYKVGFPGYFFKKKQHVSLQVNLCY